MSDEAEALLRQVKDLRRELGRKQRALSESLALLGLARKAGGLPLGGRGRLHPPHLRRQVCNLVEEAVAEGARWSSACQVLGLSLRTLQRWRKWGPVQDGRTETRRRPVNQLDEGERRHVLNLLLSPAFRALSPRQIVPRLADLDLYLASESTLYRLLREQRHARAKRTSTRLPQQAHKRIVSAPNQIWNWDISYLKGPGPGSFLYLYLVMDVFSRRIMGWRIHSEESAERASELIRQTCRNHGINPTGLVLHADNGRPMKGAAMLSALRRLGIVPSFSRPRVSNDNAFVESLFHTLKGRPCFPERGFSSFQAVQAWVAEFVDWYNRQHLHSSLGYVTPDDRYSGRDAAILEHRARVYARAQSERPERWSRRARSWAPAAPAWAVVRTSHQADAKPLGCGQDSLFVWRQLA